MIDDLPGELESAVIRLQHADFGEAVAAVMVLDNAGVPVVVYDFAQHVRSRLAALGVADRRDMRAGSDRTDARDHSQLATEVAAAMPCMSLSSGSST